MREIGGHFAVQPGRYGIVVARFNERITEPLWKGAYDALLRHGVSDEAIDLVHVPGSWELPAAAMKLAQSGQYAAIVALGAVLRGATTHHEHVGQGASAGLREVSLRTGVPIGFGVLTCDTLEQALERSGTKSGNKGVDAALAALEMADLWARLNALGL